MEHVLDCTCNDKEELLIINGKEKGFPINQTQKQHGAPSAQAMYAALNFFRAPLVLLLDILRGLSAQILLFIKRIFIFFIEAKICQYPSVS